MKKEIKRICDGEICLRMCQFTDLPLTLSWRNKEDIRQWFFNSDPITMEGHRSWFQNYLERDNDFLFIIEYEKTPVGQISLYNINWENQTGEYGRLLIGDPIARGRGVSKRATNILLKIGFDELLLNEINLEVKKTNLAAINVYSSCGFKIIEETNQILRMSISSI